MAKFEASKTAKVIRFFTSYKIFVSWESDIGKAGTWAFLWTVVLGLMPIALIYPDRAATPSWVGAVVIVAFLPVLLTLMIIIGAAHGEFFTDSTLTRSERKGAKQLKDRRGKR